MTTTSDQFLIDGKSFVTETGDDSATVVRTSTGAALTQTEIEEAGEHYDSDLKQINYAKIFNLKFGSNFISKLGASSEWMAKAITDRKYKNAFKKATNKNSSNISSIEPETSSVFATATNNTDGNGASTLNRGGSVLRYPKNEDVKSYDYLKVCAYEYKPRNFGKDGIGLMSTSVLSFTVFPSVSSPSSLISDTSLVLPGLLPVAEAVFDMLPLFKTEASII